MPEEEQERHKRLSEERLKCLSAVITGLIEQLPNERNLFRAYSYRSKRFTNMDESEPLFAWPPFMVAQPNILGKNYHLFRTTLEQPSIDEPKAFEALVQLAILVRLLAKEKHKLVPFHPSIMDDVPADYVQKATEMFHVAETANTLDGILSEVKSRFMTAPGFVQVIAVPMYASFPTYDFFLLHREGKRNWKVIVGYQCKQGSENPSEDAWKDILTSVWIEGKCRRYRVRGDGQRVSTKLHRGWTLLSESNQADLLGVSVAEALPQEPVCGQEERQCCVAEQEWDARHLDSRNSQHRAKRQRV
uniref:Uncharacterized protein n=1 Tax=Amphora coffeiformis TaxID=265554 RepID=A0A6S8NPX8_9STRA|mmetsp:Transcript_14197/g.27122  ORF Transcript_14197/g.27122 Transcript_14197/m.27122 type:complete len:303 (-) Transcript_14197:162-1070(-)